MKTKIDLLIENYTHEIYQIIESKMKQLRADIEAVDDENQKNFSEFMLQKSSIEKWVSVEELAKYFNVAKKTIYDWVEKGTIPEGVKLGPRQTRWKISDVEKSFNNNEQQSENKRFNVVFNLPQKKSTRGRKSKIKKLQDLQKV